MSSLAYEFPNPIVVILKRTQLKNNTPTVLQLEKDSIHAKNWIIPIKHLDTPIIDEDKEILKLKDKKNNKEFVCQYSLSYGGNHHTNMRRRQSRQVRSSVDLHRRGITPVPDKLREFITCIEERISKYQNKHTRKFKLESVSSDQHRQNLHDRDKTRPFGSRDWARKSKPQRQYGRSSLPKSKKRRQIEKMLDNWEKDQLEEDEEEFDKMKENEGNGETAEISTMDVTASHKVEDNDTSSLSDEEVENNDNSIDNVKARNLEQMNDTDSLQLSLEDKENSHQGIDNEELEEFILPKKKKRRLKHNRKDNFDDSDDDDDDEFGTPILVKESQYTKSPMGSKTLFDAEDSKLLMEDSVSMTVTDEEDQNNLKHKNPIYSNTPSSPCKKTESQGVKPVAVTTEKIPTILSSFFQPRKNETKSKSITSTPPEQVNKKKTPNTSPINSNITNVPSPQEKIQPHSHTIKEAKSTPSPQSLGPDQMSTPNTAKRSLTNYFSKNAVTPTQSTSSNKSKLKCSLSPRSKDNDLPSGLTNLGNTCYLNSSLQLLFSLPPFFRSLMENCNSKCSNQYGSLYSTLMNLYRNTNTGINNGKVQTAIYLKKCIDSISKRFLGFEQRDAHEFLSDLIDLLHEEMNERENSGNSIKPNGEIALVEAEDDEYEQVAKYASKRTEKINMLPTNEFFCMKVKVCLCCDSCAYTRCKEEIYRHLSLDVDTTKNEIQTTLQEGLQQFFAPEKREISCEKCKDGKVATQTMQIIHKPKALLLHLKRFILQPSSNSNQVSFRKNQIAVEYPHVLDLSSTSSGSKEKEAPYRLRGLVHHIGSTAYCGHYTTDAMREGKWLRFDDGSVKEMQEEDIMKSDGSRRSVYMLLYELE